MEVKMCKSKTQDLFNDFLETYGAKEDFYESLNLSYADDYLSKKGIRELPDDYIMTDWDDYFKAAPEHLYIEAAFPFLGWDEANWRFLDKQWKELLLRDKPIDKGGLMPQLVPPFLDRLISLKLFTGDMSTSIEINEYKAPYRMYMQKIAMQMNWIRKN